MVALLLLPSKLELQYTKKIFWPKIWIILAQLGLIALSDMIFLTKIAAAQASATRISLINPSESICIKGKDACIKKISKETLKSDDELNTFLQIEASANTPTIQGYNTDSFVVKLDARKKQQVSHSLKLSDVPIVNIGGTDYREFILTVKEPVQTKPNPDLAKIVLEKLEIFLGNSPNLISYPNFNGKASKTFDLEPNTVVLQDSKSQDGSYKYFVYINNGFFTDANKAVKDQGYVYLFSKFSDAEARVQSWSVRKLKRSSLLPVIPAGAGGAGGGEILGSMFPLAGLLALLGGGGGGSGGGGGQALNTANNAINREFVVPQPLPAKSGKPPTEVPEPTTVLGSLIGIGLLVKARSRNS
ncbi:hypothetical protein NIES2100_70520 [Calothrix sp. NIES-2100]|uniref:PEP-CTERM sorting domain-containing protein n=1 Tax=Calothrix sp. NIES-2100 TaxID=1954172 RepID=UPI000B61CB23|nr:hypothetical protein NIES2100_70520 [Calothrix sp. NIES-2100]